MLALFLLILLSLGCNRAEKARREAAEKQLDQIRKALEKYERTQELSPPEFSHVLAIETEYYTMGPQQGRPADGRFSAGTRLNVTKDAGSYVLVQTENAVEAYVAADAVRQPGNDISEVSGIVRSGNQFAIDLYQQLRSEEGNLFFSPTSISTALAMTFAGADGETEAEMAKTLHFDLQNERLHDSMKVLQSSWIVSDKKKGIRLSLANRLWGQESYEFRPAFLKTTRDKYGAELARLSFSQSEEVRKAINGWVEDRTEEKVTELIPAGLLSSDTKLVLTNALYFHGIWSDPFQKGRTKEKDFHQTASEKIKVPMMHRGGGFRYAEVNNLQILKLPYGDDSLSMVVVLPKEVEGLADVESKLTFKNLQGWFKSLKHEDNVEVYLPKFKVTSQFQLSNTLKAMGMKSAFDANTADFSEMTGGRDLFISAVIHKAFIDVNEEGTEAAAATGVVMAPTSPLVEEKREPIIFRADHPFVFMIRDQRNGAILFVGRVTNPVE